MTEDVYQRLKPFVQDKKPDDAVFTWEDGSPLTSSSPQAARIPTASRFVSPRWLKSRPFTALKGKGLPGHLVEDDQSRQNSGSPGSIRFSYTTSVVQRFVIMMRAGVSEKTAMRISGHQDRSVFDRYGIGNDAGLADAAKKIENQRNGRKLVTE